MLGVERLKGIGQEEVGRGFWAVYICMYVLWCG